MIVLPLLYFLLGLLDGVGAPQVLRGVERDLLSIFAALTGKR